MSKLLKKARNKFSSSSTSVDKIDPESSSTPGSSRSSIRSGLKKSLSLKRKDKNKITSLENSSKASLSSPSNVSLDIPTTEPVVQNEQIPSEPIPDKHEDVTSEDTITPAAPPQDDDDDNNKPVVETHHSDIKDIISPESHESTPLPVGGFKEAIPEPIVDTPEISPVIVNPPVNKQNQEENLLEDLGFVADELEPLLQRSSHLDNGSITSASVLLNPETGFSVILLLKKLFVYLDVRDPKLVHYILLLLVILFGIFYLTYRQLDTLVAQSVELNLQSITIDSVSDNGLNSHVVGSIYINYDKLPNIFYKNLLKFGSLLVGSVTILPSDSIHLYVNPIDINVAPLHLVDVSPPELSVNVVNKRITDIDFTSEATFIKENIVKFSKYLEQIDEDVINLEIQGVFSGNIKGKFFNFDANDINVVEPYSFTRSDLMPDIDINELEIASTKESITLSAEVVVTNQFSFEFSLDSINWDLMIKSCEGELIEVGDWKSSSFMVSPEGPIAVHFNGSIAKIPDPLLKDCKDGLSPITRMIQDYIDEKPITVYVRASKHQDEDLPQWLSYILQNSVQGISLVLPKEIVEVGGIDIDSVELEVPVTNKKSDDEEEESLIIHLNTNLTGLVDVPVDFNFSIPQFKSSFSIKDNSTDKEIIKGNSNNYSNLVAKKVKDYLDLNILLNSIEVEVLNPALIGQFVNSILQGDFEDFTNLYVDLELEDLFVDLPPILKSTISRLKLRKLKLPPNHKSLKKRQLPSIDDILHNLNVTIDGIYFIDSYPEDLNLFIDFSLFNPTNFSIDLPQETISIGAQFNESKIVDVILHDLFIPKNERVNLTAELQIHSETLTDKIVLENFLSQFISTVEGLSIDLVGHSAKKNKGLNELLNQISILNVTIPEVDLDNSGEEEEEDDNEGGEDENEQGKGQVKLSGVAKKNPFLKEAIIHIFSSEVELTLFNPIINAELNVELFQAEAKHEDIILGYIQHQEFMVVPPGLFKTPKIPIIINQGLGTDILRKALNGELDVEVIASIGVRLDQFEVDLLYKGSNMNTEIRF